MDGLSSPTVFWANRGTKKKHFEHSPHHKSHFFFLSQSDHRLLKLHILQFAVCVCHALSTQSVTTQQSATHFSDSHQQAPAMPLTWKLLSWLQLYQLTQAQPRPFIRSYESDFFVIVIIVNYSIRFII